MEVAMERPLIAIVGSIDPNRTYDPALDNGDLARQACVELGQAQDVTRTSVLEQS
jgi:hypothetical protein